MPTCPNCGADNPDGFRVCGTWGAPLSTEAPEPGEERNIVTRLFYDLVGFTARSEWMDPEDVRDWAVEQGALALGRRDGLRARGRGAPGPSDGSSAAGLPRRIEHDQGG